MGRRSEGRGRWDLAPFTHAMLAITSSTKRLIRGLDRAIKGALGYAIMIALRTSRLETLIRLVCMAKNARIDSNSSPSVGAVLSLTGRTASARSASDPTALPLGVKFVGELSND